MKKQKWYKSKYNFHVVVMDGNYPMGKLSLDRISREVTIANAITPFVYDGETGKRPATWTPWNKDEYSHIRAKGEDYRRQIKEETRKIGDREQRLIVFPDFVVNGRKLDPLVYKLIQDGIPSVQYSFIKHVVDSGLINRVFDSWSDEEKRAYLVDRNYVWILDGDKVMGVLVKGDERGKLYAGDHRAMLNRDWIPSNDRLPAGKDRELDDKFVPDKGGFADSILFPDFRIRREDLYQLISRHLLSGGLTDSDICEMQYDTLKELVEHGRMNK